MKMKMMVRGTLRVSWWGMKAHSRHNGWGRVASLWGGRWVGPLSDRAEDPHTHLGAAWGTADKWPLLLQIHLGFLINLKDQGRGRKKNRKPWIPSAASQETRERQPSPSAPTSNSQVKMRKTWTWMQVLPCRSPLGSLQSGFLFGFLEHVFAGL